MVSPSLADLLPIARDMTASLSRGDRSRRIVAAVRRALPCDAVALLRLDGDTLQPVASMGLAADIGGRRFVLAEHPRFAAIAASSRPLVFATDSPLPDPYDGLIAGAPPAGQSVHSCLGCPLRVDGELVGVLTADALATGAFDGVSADFLEHLAALAGAALRTGDLIEALERRAEQQGLVARDLVRDALERRGGLVVGASAQSRRLWKEIELIANSDFGVLVTGPTGSGKELVVRSVHQLSRRKDAALVYVNCAALPESVAESELFGHRKGAFTGAETARAGKFAAADGASLFLDEIGELPMHLQAKLLRVLQEGEIQPVGADHTERVDVRVFAATNRDLEVEVAAGRFRADLLHRLDVCRIRVPALCERRPDIHALAGHFADRVRRRLGTGPVRYESAALALLERADWPGNIRELENVTSRAILRASGRVAAGAAVVVGVADLDVRVPSESGANTWAGPQTVTDAAGTAGTAGTAKTPATTLREAREAFERDLIRRTVEREHGNWAAAARSLGIDRANLHRLARALGLK